MKRLILIFFTGFLLAGCTKAPWIVKSTPPFQTVNKDLYSIQLIPSWEDTYGYRCFDLVINNKTDQDIELIWDRTYFLNEGQTTGGFMFEGVIYRDRNEFKPPDIIFPKIKYQKTIYPNILAKFDKYIGWYSSTMYEGEKGAYITLKVYGEEVHEKLLVVISAGYDESQRYTTIFGKLFGR